MDHPVKWMSINEFRDSGFLQEANRLFFHPHGLSLGVTVAHDGQASISGVMDLRDEPEGASFEGFAPGSDTRAATVHREAMRQLSRRIRKFGWVSAVQPITDAAPKPTEQA